MNSYNAVSDIEKHSASHVLALAVSRLYPMVRIGIGPVTKNGFFYDFELTEFPSKKDLEKIEDEANRIIQENLPFKQIILDRESARNIMLQKGQIFKSEIINSIPDEEISFFKTGDEFMDLCRGPHLVSTKYLGPIKIISAEETFWNDDKERSKLVRINGMVFKNIEDLAEYEKNQLEKEKRNFKDFSTNNGLGFFDDENFFLTQKGYSFIHNLFTEIEEKTIDESVIKYNLPIEILNEDRISQLLIKSVFKETPSYKRLPITILSRSICQNTILKDRKISSEIFTLSKFSKSNEVIFNITFLEKFISIFRESNLDFFADLKFFDLDDSLFQSVSTALQRSLISHNRIRSDEDKNILVELKVNDELGREWLFARLKIINNFSKTLSFGDKIINLGFTSINIYPYNIFAYYIENLRDKIPAKLSFDKFIIIPVSKEFETYSEEVLKRLKKQSIDAEVAYGNLSLNAKISKFEKKYTPIILVVGEKEVDNDSVSIRINDRDEGLVAVDNVKSYLDLNFFTK